jgi:hypothetical protein
MDALVFFSWYGAHLFDSFPVCPSPILFMCGSHLKLTFFSAACHHIKAPLWYRKLVSGQGTTEHLSCVLPRENKNNHCSANTPLKLLSDLVCIWFGVIYCISLYFINTYILCPSALILLVCFEVGKAAPERIRYTRVNIVRLAAINNRIF